MIHHPRVSRVLPFIALALLLIPCLAAAQTLRINEVMSSNSAFLADEDGDFSDWLELYNPGPASVNVANWGLSDKKSNPFKWTLPDRTLPPQSWMLIFASSKDRKQAVAAWETVVRKSMIWRYRLGSAAIPAAWMARDFNDTGWNQGLSGFGFGDNDDATTIANSNLSVYGRITFQVADSAAVLGIILDMDYDDGFVAYINGREVARANLGTAGEITPWNRAATNGDHEAAMYRNLPPDRFIIANPGGLLRQGKNVLAVQVHNSSYSSSDLTMIPFLSLGYATAPANGSGADPRLNLQPAHLHSNFAISAAGETLVLTTPAGALVDSVTVPSLAADISYARVPDGAARWIFAARPTPAAANHSGEVINPADAVEFSRTGGFYQQPFSFTLACATPGAEIRYTRDGAEPDSLAARYTTSVGIGQTTVIRARAFAPGYAPGPIVTHTYILEPAPSPLPVISLTTDPVNLWDQEIGIYVLGTEYQNQDPYFGANFWEDWERPVHIEFFEPGGALGFRQDAGMKIFGAWSRARPQKSLAFFARSSYGSSSFNYRLFPELPFTSYHSFILRNGGNDWDRTLFADGLIQSRLRGVDLEHQAYRPCTVFLNGAYWGILNLREKVNEYFLAQHHGGDPKKIDLLEMDGAILEGNNEHYIEMRDFIASKDLTVPANYAWVQTKMDVDNFITYEAVQILIDNRDWPGNNIKFWRPQTPEGRWRWILYDTEWGFGINAYGSGGNIYPYNYNTLAFATSPTQSPNHHGNPPWSTLLLRRLLMNNDFKNAFINRFADLMNGPYRETPTGAHIDSLQRLLAKDMRRHYEKWKNPVSWIPARLWWNSFSDWYTYIGILRQFAANRPAYMRTFIMQKWGIQKVITLQLHSDPPGAGRLLMNDFLEVTASPWIGNYFSGIPIKITAKPAPGYRFAGWEGAAASADPELTLMPGQNAALTARFVPSIDSTARVVLNEINYKSAATFDTEDWIEIHNSGLREADLSGWHLKDDDDSHDFIIPENTILEAGGYLVVGRDTGKFRTLFPDPAIRLIGSLSYGLSSGGDQVRLYDRSGALADSVAFGIAAPWPAAANGGGATLELRAPDLDNTLAASWTASAGHGTPGAMNSGSTSVAGHGTDPLPEEFALEQNHPNPFNAGTTITYSLPAAAEVRLEIYTVQGRALRTLVRGSQAAGRHQIRWDGRDDSGAAVSSGLYFCLLQNGPLRQIRRMLLIR